MMVTWETLEQDSTYNMNITPLFLSSVQKYSQQPFEWGKNDCALMVASIYREAYGIELAEGIVGTYSDEYHGMRKIVELGGWDKILTDRGFTKINSNFVQRADFVVAEGALGIWVGTYAIFAGGITRTLDKIEATYKYIK